MTIKPLIKSLITSVLARVATLTLRQHRYDLLIVTYHRVLPGNDPRLLKEQPGMYVHPDVFDMHLYVLKKYFDIIDLNTLFIDAPLSSSPKSKPRCAITFDDGWLDNYQHAFPLLLKHRVPATIFLVSELVGSSKDFWPGQLASLLNQVAQQEPDAFNDSVFNWLKCLNTPNIKYAFGATPPTQNEIDQIISACKVYSEVFIYQNLNAVKKHLKSRGLTLSEERVLLNQNEIVEMHQSGLISFGSHTANHIRLSDEIDSDMIASEIAGSQHTLRQLIGGDINLFCYPNGDYGDKALACVKQYYKAAVTTQKGWNTPTNDPYQLKRIHLHNDIAATQAQFLSRIRGWM